MSKQTTKTIKSYGTTSHAKRALNSIGLAALQAYDKLVTINAEGRYEFILEKAEAIQEKADNAKQDSYEEPSTREKSQAKMQTKAAPAPVAKPVAAKPAPAPVVKPAAPEAAPKVEPKKPAPVVASGEIVRESSVERPCKLVWHIADEMVGARRKDVLAECVRRGVAFYTARTQYQLWLSVKNGTAK